MATGWCSTRATRPPMACPEALEQWDEQLGQVVRDTASWRIDGQTLELLDGGGNPLALLQAVYLY